jgi:trehalose 6-phosphate synthase
MPAAHDLLVMSNRGPLSFNRRPDGTVQVKRASGGGLVVCLGPGVERTHALWLAAATSADDLEAAREGPVESGGFRVQPVQVDPDDYRAYYDVVANQTLWFCLHGLWDLPRRPRLDRYWWAAWETFRSVNERFASVAADTAADGATVLVQDYHLALVPALLTARRPDVRVASFVHTPWCSAQEMSVLPDEVTAAILSGLSDGGPCGFHSPRWAAAFESCCETHLGRPARTFVTPAVPDVDDLRSVATSPACDDEVRRLDTLVGNRQLIVRVDRMELSKNVLRGFWAFDELLETRPDLRGRVAFAAKVYPSRQGLAEYLAYAQEVQALAGRLNAKWADADWTPILLDTVDYYPSSVAALRRADVLLVNPVRDGLNLVVKEGPLVNQRNAVVVLSQQAGAWDEVGAHTIGVNPFDVSGMAKALARALDIAPEDRAEQAEGLRKAIEARSPEDWFEDQRAAAAGG